MTSCSKLVVLGRTIPQTNWGTIWVAFVRLITNTLEFWTVLYGYIFKHLEYSAFPALNANIRKKVQYYSLSLIFKMWSLPHYRSPSYQQDMKDNLRNVAIPGTGIPLSIFCINYWVCLFYIMLLNPVICFFGAVNKAYLAAGTFQEFAELVSQYYIDHLSAPDDWFSYWRLNCRLVAFDSLLSQCKEYQMEDKWTFLVEGKKLKVPVSPYDDQMPSIVCKHKSIEGGMGIYFYENAALGGDWILQQRLHNAEWLNELLPPNAPLSTMRVITTSKWSLSGKEGGGSEMEEEVDEEQFARFIRAESTLLRLGRSGAATDHSSVLFDVDSASGTILKGTTNMQWYQLGLRKAATCPWLPPSERPSHHPDGHIPVTGKIVPKLQDALEIVKRAHFTMMRHVPIVGWDVAFTTVGVVLLEVNLSCNFFKGSFNVPRYIEFVNAHFERLDATDARTNRAPSSTTAGRGPPDALIAGDSVKIGSSSGSALRNVDKVL